ncbi:Leukotriene A-4 hydrolase-like protein [Zea mays]|uniref:Leukotriene A-4 hydrolase-like protein n=2 Tax=Zea mays TaxID=4577 RepID=A0A1D6FVR9_MAIZE|nr:Leukotriene A-4 hydrolase-like protein [Zea mays]AQK95555.1 Leukotriene A-4 hydrolase-like protein [Zea mays]AQK95557.1 Leukotriene A-4 hydrolase-like protein [Zea mays]AQK95558.1 Leukotriene A-4 hydrolase-like protein [Zea mays]AQK95560.1 Leukotriene A-4 hydrolase-like protein [Zea mays]
MEGAIPGTHPNPAILTLPRMPRTHLVQSLLPPHPLTRSTTTNLRTPTPPLSELPMATAGECLWVAGHPSLAASELRRTQNWQGATADAMYVGSRRPMSAAAGERPRRGCPTKLCPDLTV